MTTDRIAAARIETSECGDYCGKNCPRKFDAVTYLLCTLVRGEDKLYEGLEYDPVKQVIPRLSSCKALELVVNGEAKSKAIKKVNQIEFDGDNRELPSHNWASWKNLVAWEYLFAKAYIALCAVIESREDIDDE